MYGRRRTFAREEYMAARSSLDSFDRGLSSMCADRRGENQGREYEETVMIRLTEHSSLSANFPLTAESAAYVGRNSREYNDPVFRGVPLGFQAT